MIVFVNNVYVSEDDIKYIELVIHDESTLSNSYKVGTYEECLKFCLDMKSKGWKVNPLNSGEFSLLPDVRVTKINDSEKISTGLFKEDSLLSIYSLYWDLASHDGIYLDKNYHYPNGYTGVLSEFSNISVCEDSMKITIPVIYNNKIVATRELISQKENPIHHSFKIAIPIENAGFFYKYRLKEIETVEYNNKKFISYEYKQNLSIYRNLSDFKFSEPVAVYYGNKQRVFKTMNHLAKLALSSLGVSLTDSLEVAKEVKLRRSSLFNDMSGVFIKHSTLFASEDLLKQTIDVIMSIQEGLVKNKNRVDISTGVKKLLITYKLPKYFELPVKTILNAFINSNGNEVMLIDYLMDTYRTSLLYMLECELYLFNLRTSCIVNPSSLDYKEGKKLFYIHGYGEKMKMEVWLDNENS